MHFRSELFIVMFLFLFSQTGCVVVPTLNIDAAPRADLRHIKVVDSDSGNPLPKATVTCYVFAYQTHHNWLYDGVDGHPSGASPAFAESHFSYEKCGDAEYKTGDNVKWGWGNGMLLFPCLYFETRNRHYGLVVVESPGYQPIIIGTLCHDDPGIIVVSLLEPKAMTILDKSWTGLPGSSQKSFTTDQYDPSGTRYWPSVKDGALSVKLAKLQPLTTVADSH